MYGEPNYLPFDEKYPTRAVNPYGRCKLHVEEMLADLSDSDPSWRISRLRYFNLVRAHESGLIGETLRGTPKQSNAIYCTSYGRKVRRFEDFC